MPLIFCGYYVAIADKSVSFNHRVFQFGVENSRDNLDDIAYKAILNDD